MILKPDLVAYVLFLALSLSTTNKASASKNDGCPYRWVRIGESCYYYEKWKMHFDRAEVMCLQRGATTFVANSLQEYNEVMSRTPKNSWAWTGLYQGVDDNRPKWKYPGGIDASQIKWLRTSPDHDWNTASKCVAHYNSDSSYAQFYFCGMEFYSVCERNATLLNQMWDPTAYGF